MTKYVCFKEEDWKNLADRINWGESFIDARAARIMNEPRYEDLDDE